MSDNVIQFNDALKRAEEMEKQQEQESKCEHCNVIEFAINSFMENLTSQIKLNQPDQEIIANELYDALDFIWDRSKVATLRPYLHAMMREVDDIVGYGDED